jgi:hypothetical protein
MTAVSISLDQVYGYSVIFYTEETVTTHMASTPRLTVYIRSEFTRSLVLAAQSKGVSVRAGVKQPTS